MSEVKEFAKQVVEEISAEHRVIENYVNALRESPGVVKVELDDKDPTMFHVQLEVPVPFIFVRIAKKDVFSE